MQKCNHLSFIRLENVNLPIVNYMYKREKKKRFNNLMPN